MKPVQFPKQKTDDYPDASKLPRADHSQDSDDDDEAKPAQQNQNKTPPESDASQRDAGQFNSDATGCGQAPVKSRKRGLM